MFAIGYLIAWIVSIALFLLLPANIVVWARTASTSVQAGKPDFKTVPGDVAAALTSAWINYVGFFWKQVGWITVIEAGAYSALYAVFRDEQGWTGVNKWLFAMLINIVAVILLIQLFCVISRMKDWMDAFRLRANQALGDWNVPEPPKGFVFTHIAKRGAGGVPLIAIWLLVAIHCSLLLRMMGAHYEAMDRPLEVATKVEGEDRTESPKVAMTFATQSESRLVVALNCVTLVVSVAVLFLVGRSEYEHRKTSQVWRTLDDCMAEGYKLQDGGADYEQAARWIGYVARFCERALGTHAMKLIQQWGTSPEQIRESGGSARDVIQWVLGQIHLHIADKVVDGRIHPEFDRTLWKRWNPTMPPPE